MATSTSVPDLGPVGWRLGALPFQALTLLLTVGQVAAGVMVADSGALGTPQIYGAALGVAWLGQALKVPFTMARLRDLAQPVDDAVWTLVPVMNLVQWWRCRASTPSADVHTDRRVRLAAQTQAAQAYGRAWTLLVRTAPVVAGVVGVEALLAGWLGVASSSAMLAAIAAHGRALLAGDPSPYAGWASGFAAMTGLMLVVLTLQFIKRHKASRASWWPVFLLPASLGGWLALSLAMMAPQGQGAALLGLWTIGLDLSWRALAGSFVVAVALLAAHRVQHPADPTDRSTLGEAFSRWTTVVPAHGSRVLAVGLGMQLIVPGILYAISFGFTDMLAVLHPDRPALNGSRELIAGIRRKVFKVLAVSVLGSAAGSLLTWLLLADGATLFASLFDPSLMPLSVAVLSRLIDGFFGWWCLLALYVLFVEREGLRLARDARLAEAAVSEAAAP